MLVVVLAILLGLGATACGDNQEDFVDHRQGVCTDLDEQSCRADSRCQQAYLESAFSRGPYRCLLLHAEAPTGDPACHSLGYDACRTRSDCSPLVRQLHGPADESVGDPYFLLCEVEADAPYNPWPIVLEQ